METRRPVFHWQRAWARARVASRAKLGRGAEASASFSTCLVNGRRQTLLRGCCTHKRLQRPREVAISQCHEQDLLMSWAAATAFHSGGNEASVSCSERPHDAHLWGSLAVRKRTWTSLKNKLTPTIIMTLASNRPVVALSVTSPYPVVVKVVTVKYRASHSWRSADCDCAASHKRPPS
jgi:hypothetical protein